MLRFVPLSALITLLLGSMPHATGTGHHGVNDGSLLEKRQNYTCSGAGLEDICQTNTTECIADLCASCSGVVLIAECCALSTYTAMFQCLLNLYNNPSELTMTVGPSSTNSADTSTITGSPSSPSNSSLDGLDACLSLEAVAAGCASQTPGFTMEPFASQASCLCYSGNAYQPDVYDGYFSTCMAYLSTAAPVDYSSLTAAASGTINLAPCDSVGLTGSIPSSSASYIGLAPTSSAETRTGVSSPGSSATTGLLPTQTSSNSGGGSLFLVSFAIPLSLFKLGLRCSPKCRSASFVRLLSVWIAVCMTLVVW
jgi:hypothetical protein